jgi:hypothetical protein
MPPRITSGGPDSTDEQITRTDISPEDIRKMSIPEIHELLARIRNSRQTSNKAVTPRASKPKPIADKDDLEDLE